ncbi:hypothetical protein ABZ725_18160 [Streptomyces sp. NPDC006872]|uniref:hypothetical protein n=1 Tax=Streptomyces sp. NPDC006872 TaxID=3155720 RepID=UPI0033E2E8A0
MGVMLLMRRLARSTKRFRYSLDVLGGDHAHVHERRPGMGDHRPQMPLHPFRKTKGG